MSSKNCIILILLFLTPFPSTLYAQCMGTLVWQDEFNGSSIDMTKWSYELGNGCPSLCGWGNSELEYYTNSTNNIRVTGGNLVIEVRPESISGSSFSSGKIISRNKAFWTYGRFEASIRMPEGNGLWPAFWMLPEVNAWPTTGEIDITEYRGDQNTKTSGTLHYGNTWPGNLWDGTDYYHTASLAAAFHLYAVEWDANEIRWYFDDRLTKIETRTPNSLNPASNNASVWPWTTNFHFLINLAVGGWFTGTTNPAAVVLTKPTMEVDYVRVYNMASALGTQWPYSGVPAPIPGKIEAEEYDRACDQAAYYDTDLPNNGGAFRGERVDIEACADVGGGYDVGWTANGEWMEYTVNVASTGTYDFTFRVASTSNTGRLHVEMDGVDRTGLVSIPNTGAWTNWQNVTVTNKSLTAGNHIFRVYIDVSGFNLNYFNVVTNTVLPISLLDFSLDLSNSNATLYWSAENEQKIKDYTLQKSTDLTTWTSIATIPALKNSGNISRYNYEDPTVVTEKTYYRVIQTTEGEESFYSTVLVASPTSLLDVAPNPFNEYTTVWSTEEGIEIGLYSATGEKISSYKTNASSSIQIGEGLPKGIYILKNSKGEVKKLVKQ